jgi:hypothetical protein
MIDRSDDRNPAVSAAAERRDPDALRAEQSGRERGRDCWHRQRVRITDVKARDARRAFGRAESSLSCAWCHPCTMQ